MTVEEKFNLAEAKIRQPRFLENRGMGNEVGYYIFDYDPAQELQVRSWVADMKAKYDDGNAGFRIVEHDLYNIVIDILKQKGYLEKCFDMEEKRGLPKVCAAIASSIRITSDENLIIKYIRERLEPNTVIFLTGIGKCYPFLRSHNVLNNMHMRIDEVPVVMFYPGRFSGLDLNLFGEIDDNNYYRAFRLVD